MRLLNRRELLQAAAALAATPVGARARAADGSRPSVIDGAIVGDVGAVAEALEHPQGDLLVDRTVLDQQQAR